MNRFWDKVEKTDGCWVWKAAKANGYGRFSIGRRMRLAHRVAYGLIVGTIPDGMQLDHLCRNRACVNPAHLEPVTQLENTRRGEAGTRSAARQLIKTQCPLGHKYTEENTFRRKNRSNRECRTCMRKRTTKWRLLVGSRK